MRTELKGGSEAEVPLLERNSRAVDFLSMIMIHESYNSIDVPITGENNKFPFKVPILGENNTKVPSPTLRLKEGLIRRLK
jgi:hypothetical protein